jgi:hypothetical protein
MTEVTLDTKQEQTLTIKAREFYLIHNCKVIQNQTPALLRVGEKELTDTNKGLILEPYGVYIAEEATDVYLLTYSVDVVVWLRGGE